MELESQMVRASLIVSSSFVSTGLCKYFTGPFSSETYSSEPEILDQSRDENRQWYNLLPNKQI